MEEERLTRQVPLALNMLLYPFCASKQVIELEFWLFALCYQLASCTFLMSLTTGRHPDFLSTNGGKRDMWRGKRPVCDWGTDRECVFHLLVDSPNVSPKMGRKGLEVETQSRFPTWMIETNYLSLYCCLKLCMSRKLLELGVWAYSQTQILQRGVGVLQWTSSPLAQMADSCTWPLGLSFRSASILNCYFAPL